MRLPDNHVDIRARLVDFNRLEFHMRVALFS
jgi:hypothetical protein